MATPEGAKHRDLEQRFRDLDRKVRDLASAALRRPKFEISEGDLTVSGGDLVVDGGDFLLLDTDGSTVFKLGPQQHGDRGVSIIRENGAAAIEVRKRFGISGDQSVAVYDRNGAELVVEEELGTGYAAPRFPMQVQPVLATSGTVQAGPHGFEVPVASGTFTSTHQATFLRQNQYLRMEFKIKASDTTTAGEVRVVDEGGTPLSPWLSSPWLGVRAAGSTGYTTLKAGNGSPLQPGGGVGDTKRVEVQVRRTAGAGTLTTAVSFASGASGLGY